MTTVNIEIADPLKEHAFIGNSQSVIEAILPQFNRMIQAHVFFNTLFLSVGAIEFILLITFFTFLSQSALLAFSLALVFLTFFSYFIFRLYYQAKKPEQFQELRQRYLNACKNMLHYHEGIPEHHIALAQACSKLADNLSNKECSLYRAPLWLPFLTPYLEKFSRWSHWQDVHQMQEMMLLSAIEENIKLVKCAPITIDVHAALANAYVTLSLLYTIPNRDDDNSWFLKEHQILILEQKFRDAAKCAIEEFKILKDFAPGDPWVHAQLAYSYHDLSMPLEEIKEYELMLELTPDDGEVLFKLGELYFQQGFNAKGLHIYEQLRQNEPRKAEELIKYYGSRVVGVPY